MKDSCGPTSSELLALLDQDTSSWKTFQACFPLMMDMNLDSYYGTWPSSGMMQNGKVYQQPPLVQTIYETDSGLWPTPLASDKVRTRFSLEAAIKTIESGHQNSPVYILNFLGVPIEKYPRVYEWLMGFPIGWMR